MKKLFFLTVIFFLTMSFTEKPISTNKELRPWWKAALVDAGGALGGAGSVASLAGPAVATPAGQVACVIGGIIGGASASVAYNGMVAPSNPEGGVSPQNPLNLLDDIGNKHNKLVNNFIKDNDEITAANYFSYVSKNKEKYGDGQIYLTEEFFLSQLEEVSALNETADILNFITDKLPESVDAETFKNELLKIVNSSDSEEFISKTKKIENQFFESNSLEKADEIALKAFFSTLRFSASIW